MCSPFHNHHILTIKHERGRHASGMACTTACATPHGPLLQSAQAPRQAVKQCCAPPGTRASLCPSSPVIITPAGDAPWPVLRVQPRPRRQLPPAEWLPLAQTHPRVQPLPTLLGCWSGGPGSLKGGLESWRQGNALERCSTCSTRCRARGVPCSGSRRHACSTLLFPTAAQRSRLPHGRPA